MTLVNDDFSPIFVGDTLAPFNPTFQHLDGSVFPLTGATISMKMLGISASESGTIITCTGLWTIVNAAAGTASYAYSSTDVAQAGVWLLYITITIGGKPVHADTKTLVIQPTI